MRRNAQDFLSFLRGGRAFRLDVGEIDIDLLTGDILLYESLRPAILTGVMQSGE
jgi:hypothetical protein